MGCFSFMCQNCGTSIRSDSFPGMCERTHLWLIKDGVVIEHMEGGYDSYGSVFDADGNSIQWKMDWSKVVDLMFHKNRNNGIAAIHSRCYTGEVPDERSDDDPNQGWDKVRKRYM